MIFVFLFIFYSSVAFTVQWSILGSKSNYSNNLFYQADAGGSPSLVARGFDTTQTGAEQVEIQVPNEKVNVLLMCTYKYCQLVSSNMVPLCIIQVGLVIGKGGETIKNLQTKSGARIQVSFVPILCQMH